MPLPRSETDRRIDNLESQVFDRLYIDDQGSPLVDIIPRDVQFESIDASAEGAFIVISWANWRPEILGYEVWVTRPDGSSDIVSTVIQSPAVFTVSVDEATPMRFTIRAKAGERTISFDKSPSVAALIPAPATGALGPNSVGETELIHDGPNRIVIVSADILSLVANKISAGTLDAGQVNVINLNASNINAGALRAAIVNAIRLDASQIITGFLSANRISGGTIVGSQYRLESSNERMLIDLLGFRQFNVQNNKYVSIISGRAYFGITIGQADHDLVKIDSNEPIPDYSTEIGSISIFNTQGHPRVYMGGDIDSLGGQITGHIQHNNVDAVTFQLVALRSSTLCI